MLILAACTQPLPQRPIEVFGTPIPDPSIRAQKPVTNTNADSGPDTQMQIEKLQLEINELQNTMKQELPATTQ